MTKIRIQLKQGFQNQWTSIKIFFSDSKKGENTNSTCQHTGEAIQIPNKNPIDIFQYKILKSISKQTSKATIFTFWDFSEFLIFWKLKIKLMNFFFTRNKNLFAILIRQFLLNDIFFLEKNKSHIIVGKAVFFVLY